LEHFRKKACAGLDPGWSPFFDPKLRKRKKVAQPIGNRGRGITPAVVL